MSHVDGYVRQQLRIRAKQREQQEQLEREAPLRPRKSESRFAGISRTGLPKFRASTGGYHR